MKTNEDYLFAEVAVLLALISREKVDKKLGDAAPDSPDSFAKQAVDEGWINDKERADIEQIVANRISLHDNNPEAALESVRLSVSERLDLTLDADLYAQTSIGDVNGDGEDSTMRNTVQSDPGSRERYKLTRVHGKGGLGQVWLATDRQLNREVALKEVLPKRSQDQEAHLRLQKEAQITGQLEHPNIITVYELVEDKVTEQSYYTMRFVRGETLRKALKSYHRRRAEGVENPLELRRLLYAFVSVCNAIGYAHSRGVLHRDLKPANIMLGEFGEVTVLDWGIAMTRDRRESDVDWREVLISGVDDLEKTAAGNVIGSPAYMSPEQADGRISQMSDATDVYGLGAILYAILTGNGPHSSNEKRSSLRDTMDLLARISNGPAPEPRLTNPEVPAPLNAICVKALQRLPADRYAGAQEMAKDVTRWLADEPVSVHRENFAARTARFARRHRAWAQAGAAATILIAITATAAAMVINQSRKNEAEARQIAEVALQKQSEALEREKAARAEALELFSQARRTVDKSLTGFSDVLTWFPWVQPVRVELLKTAAEDYERFSQRQTDDPQIGLEAARAAIRLGDVHNTILDFPEAKQAFSRAIESLKRLTSNDSVSNAAQKELVIAHERMATVLAALAENVAADAEFRTAISLIELLESSQQGGHELDYTTARVRLNWAMFLVSSQQFDAAQTQMNLCTERFIKLVGLSPTAEYREGYAASLVTLGTLHQQMLDTTEAAGALQEAMKCWQQLATEQPDNPVYLQRLASTRVSLAIAIRGTASEEVLLSTWKNCISDYSILQEARPGVPVFREDQAIAHFDLAGFLQELGRDNEALAEVQAALPDLIRLSTAHPEVARFRDNHARGLTRFGQILRELNDVETAELALIEAADSFRSLTEDVPDNADYMRQFAICIGSLGLLYEQTGDFEKAREHQQSAIEALESVRSKHGDTPLILDALAWRHSQLGDVLLKLGRDEATAAFAKALALRKQLSETTSEFDEGYVGFLLNCSDTSFRDPTLALEMATRLRNKGPERAHHWLLMATAQFQLANYQDCRKSLATAMSFRVHENSKDWFIKAMMSGKTGDLKSATEEFEQAVEIMAANHPGRLDVIRLKAEAEQQFDVGAEAQPE